ncbi:MAG: divergent PAP2 family protein [Caldilineaceae bacterium]
MNPLWSNFTLWLPISAAVAVQLYKFISESIRDGQWNFNALSRSGGMPSSHSAMVTSLSTAMGHRFGLNSGEFSVSIILAIIVMYDASGVRQAAGKQAKVINQIVRELFSGKPLSEEQLKELIGHTQFEVIVGALVGIAYTLILLLLIDPAP